MTLLSCDTDFKVPTTRLIKCYFLWPDAFHFINGLPGSYKLKNTKYPQNVFFFFTTVTSDREQEVLYLKKPALGDFDFVYVNF